MPAVAPFEPIAIVGRGCVLPGASSPTALWDAVAGRRDLVSAAPPDRWRLPPASIRVEPGAPGGAWSDRGGYVLDDVEEPAVAGLDPLFSWVLRSAGDAVAEAGPSDGRGGLVMGNLGFPTSGHAALAEAAWLRAQPRLPEAVRALITERRPQDRFHTGLPAALAARGLGLELGGIALDAACASSLVAIKLACDRLHDREADRMVAGAVNRADDLFLHVGFCALGALSRTGRSRPFHRAADGLLPAEGAAFVVLERLDDAIAAGRTILGVIRGIGLSNDGRGLGLLAPTSEGQLRAIRTAWARAGVATRDLGLIEAHATGTILGDRIEVESLAGVLESSEPVPIGSLKSNLGHLITTAGVAGLLKVLGGLEHAILPPTLHADEPLDALQLAPLRLVHEPEPWTGPPRAAVSAFGFGGNNAHLIVEAWDGRPTGATWAAPPRERVAVVGLEVRAGTGNGVADFAEQVITQTRRAVRREVVRLDVDGLRFPPADLTAALPSQVLILDAARAATARLCLPRDTTGVWIGLGCDSEIARYGLRWRLAGCDAPQAWRTEATEACVPALEAAGVVGTMPNIPTNRINRQLDVAGASGSVFAEELSGLEALRLAARLVACGELDAAVVGAVDLAVEPVHTEAARALLPPEHHRPGDAAVVLVVQREADARRDGHPVLAILDDDDALAVLPDLGDRFGHAHAASALVQVAAAIVVARASGAGLAVQATALGGQSGRVGVLPGDGEFVDPPVRRASRLLPAHAAALVLPDPRAIPLPRAPWLPSLTGPETAWSGSREAGAIPSVATPTPPPMVASATPPLAAGAVAGLVAEAAAIHEAWLAWQLHVHQQFLAATTWPSGVPLWVDASSGPPQTAVATPQAQASAPGPDERFPGPSFDRDDLVHLARDRISERFGPDFAGQDGYVRQVRMPSPPMLLCDRVLGIDATPNRLGVGQIWTETDVRSEAWYLDRGQMPPGYWIEAGQADLLLISWMGIDRYNQSERVYRLLGCDITFLRNPPQPGETLRYAISVDGHAQHGDVRLMFFHYDCTIDGEPVMQVRGGQAGFFTDAELDDSDGILWTPLADERAFPGPCDTPPRPTAKTRLTSDELDALSQGRLTACFGPGFEIGDAHVRTPAPPGGEHTFFTSVSELDHRGGPWGRGYLRAELPIHPDQWFFAGHFENDPCMPGTLMFEGCLQAMAVYLASTGVTVPRDGWRFEPVTGETVPLRCRGQVDPTSTHLTYEVIVDSFSAGPTPTLWADLLCTVDGLPAFHARRMGLRLVPDWPYGEAELPPPDPSPRIAESGGHRFDLRSLLACARGRPSDAFGAFYERFDGPTRVARLPGPPYHLVSRVIAIEGPQGVCKAGASVEVELDVPADAWYLDASGARTMPLCVVMEAALQPCGWLASYVGSTLTSDGELFFRNLDGTLELHREVTEATPVLRTRARLVAVSQAGPMLIERFTVECFVGDDLVLTTSTAFGFFPAVALAAQAGLGLDPEPLTVASDVRIELTDRPEAFFGGPLRLPEPRLCMLTRISGLWPDGGDAGLGRLRAEHDVDPAAWFFKAHFFQDPVQPGSLGVEAIVQALQALMIEREAGRGMIAPRFEPLALDRPITWKYRGQVVPTNHRVVIDVAITAEGEDERGRWASANGSLWVDGLPIYQVTDLVLRVVDGLPDAERLDLEHTPWLGDHRPTWTVPSLPLMVAVDRLAAAVARRWSGETVVGLRDVKAMRWVCPPAVARVVLGARQGDRVRAHLEVTDAEGTHKAVQGTVLLGAYRAAPEPLAPVSGEGVDPYAEGTLFHGPAFQLAHEVRLGDQGGSAVLDASRHDVPPSLLHPALLDAATHAVPHDALDRWFPIPTDQAAYPWRLERLDLFSPLPTSGQVRVEARPDGMVGPLPAIRLQLASAAGVHAELRLIEVLLPKGRIGSAEPALRRAFLEGRAVPGLALSDVGEVTTLRHADVRGSDWLPGTVAATWATRGDPLVEVAIKEHLAGRLGVHPRSVAVHDRMAYAASAPLTGHPVHVEVEGGVTRVRDAGPPQLDVTPAMDWWLRHFPMRGGSWPVIDVAQALIHAFLSRIEVTDPQGLAAVAGRPAVWVANHEVAIESVVLALAAPAVRDRQLRVLAKREHRDSWLGQLVARLADWPGVSHPDPMAFVDRSTPAAMLQSFVDMAEWLRTGSDVLVHAAGTRALGALQAVPSVSASLVDATLSAGAVLLPVWFADGLPAEPVQERLSFPLGLGRQRVRIGSPLRPDELRALPLAARRDRIISALNGLMPSSPSTAPDPALDEAATAAEAWAGSRDRAVIAAAVARYATMPEVRELSAKLARGEAPPSEGWLAAFATWLTS